MRDAFASTFEEQLSEKLGILVTGDLGFGVFDHLASQHPASFINAGITEQSLTSMCSGLADEGYIPFVYSIANFPTFRNLEQIRNDIAYPNKHVVITSVGAGLSYGTLGFSHFGVEDLAIIRCLPNMRILSPSDPLRAKLATETAFEVQAPTYLRLGKNGEDNFGDLEQSRHQPLRAISDQGNSVLVVSTGAIGARIEAVDRSASGQFDHFSLEEIWPVGDELISVVSKYEEVVTVEEHSPIGGLFSMLTEQFMNNDIGARLTSCSVDRSKLFKSGDHPFMLDQAGLSVDSITVAIKSVQPR